MNDHFESFLVLVAVVIMALALGVCVHDAVLDAMYGPPVWCTKQGPQVCEDGFMYLNNADGTITPVPTTDCHRACVQVEENPTRREHPPWVK